MAGIVEWLSVSGRACPVVRESWTDPAMARMTGQDGEHECNP